MQPNTIKTIALTCLIALLTLGGQSSAAPPEGKGKGGGDNGTISLRATFDADTGFPDYVPVHMRGDSLGSYVDGTKGVAVEITRDGDFRFVLGVVNTKKKGSVRRSIVLEFDERLREGDEGLSPPDLNLEPMNGVWFRTLFFGGGNLGVNFRMMKPDDVALVRLHFPFSTTDRNGFWLRFRDNSPGGQYRCRSSVGLRHGRLR